MGVVYEAIRLSLNRRVALKVLPFTSALDPHQLRRFQIEAQAAAQLHHTSIVPVFSVGCEHGVHFYAMQFIEGRTVAALVQERRDAARVGDGPPRPPAEREYTRSVARVGIQAAEASITPTARGSSTATSSRPTCWWTSAATSGSPTSAWRGSSTRQD